MKIEHNTALDKAMRTEKPSYGSQERWGEFVSWADKLTEGNPNAYAFLLLVCGGGRSGVRALTVARTARAALRQAFDHWDFASRPTRISLVDGDTLRLRAPGKRLRSRSVIIFVRAISEDSWSSLIQ